MQTLTTGNVISDFKEESVVVIGKVEIDTTSTGHYQELLDVINFEINTNIEDEVSRFCAYSFTITCLDTDKRYFSWNTASPQYGWLKQGRRIKIWAGIKINSTDYDYQWIIGRVDNYSLSTVAGEEICNISGRDFMRAILDYKLYSPNTYWGDIEKFNTFSGVANYSSTGADWLLCKGIYIAYADSISPYDGSHLTEIYRDTDFGYLESTGGGEFSFLTAAIPDYTGTNNNLWVYYYQAQSIENIVGDILYYADIFASTGARDAWVTDTDHVTPTGKEIDRVWFNTGTSAFEAIRLLAEVAQYRFYFDYEGEPVFKPKASIGESVNTFSIDCISKQDISEDIDEIYNHIIVIGESRETLG
ncbi:hypothetical protein ES708_15171 [subsurface metagenome]